MRIFKNCFEMHNEVRRDLHEMGTIVHPQTMQDKYVGDDDDYRTLELSPYDFMLLDGSDRHKWIESIGYSLRWCSAEHVERTISLWQPGHPGFNPGKAYQKRDVWAEFLHDGTFAYTYSERFSKPLGHGSTSYVGSQLQRIVEELRVNPDSRQCIVGMWRPDYDPLNLGGNARVPCTMYYQFLRRIDGLRMIYTMRSSDFHTHFPYDIWLALQMQMEIATRLETPIGPFTFFTGSLHLYAKDADQGVF